MVVRRGEEAGDHQLPHLEARARRPVLRPHLRPGQGLRVPVRQIQAPQAPRRGLREVRRGSDPFQGAPRTHGPHRASEPGSTYLVPEVAAFAHRPFAGHDPARHRARALLRVLRGGGPRSHRLGTEPTAHRRGILRLPRGTRRRVHRQDGRRGRSGSARSHRPRARDRDAARGNPPYQLRNQNQEGYPSA